MKKSAKLYALVIIIALVIGTGIFYFTRFKSMATIAQLTNYDKYNIYQMEIMYDYNIDNIIKHDITDTDSLVKAILGEVMPFIPMKVDVPNFGCSAFKLVATDGEVIMGRNYDFRYDTSAMLVRCNPKNGYKSIAFAALNNINADAADKSMRNRFACLATPFICLDGVNEKGVSIAVLTLDCTPTRQSTGKPNIGTSLAIRLVLDRAATTEEAVNLLKKYDMVASNGRDYHFFISDATGDSRAVEYDCNTKTRELRDTKTDIITNFFILYKDKVLPNRENGKYGHGKERYDSIAEILSDEKGAYTRETAWRALEASSQKPKNRDITSNTQWSIVFSNSKLNAEIALHKLWKDAAVYFLNGYVTTNS